MRRLSLILISTLFITSLFAQTGNSINDIRNIYDEKGDFYFDKDAYGKAIVYYNMAYQKDNNNYYSVLRKAETFEKLELYTQAEICYQAIFETDLNIDNIYRLQYALVLLRNNKVKAFEEWLGKYNQAVNAEISEKNYISTSKNRVKLYKDTTITHVVHVDKVNSSFSEINPTPYNDMVLFSSNRKDKNASSANTYYNVFAANYGDNGKLSKPYLYNTSLNSTKNEGPIAFFDVNNTMYFTRSTGMYSGLQTYSSNIPFETNEALSLTQFSIGGFSDIGQVTFNSTGTVIYFVALEDGQSSLDIFSSELSDGNWGNPRNIGTAVNTSGNETHPFLLNDSLLYFSSNGHNGIGGYDLFRINLNAENPSAENLGASINSPNDDYGLSFTPDGLTAYFSSNRPGGKGAEDIYRLHLLDLKIKYAGYRHKRTSSMESDKINLYISNGDEYNIGSEGNNGFNFGFLPQENYKMVIQHENAKGNNIVSNNLLSNADKQAQLLHPAPIERTEIPLDPGMKYQFTAGLNPISDAYKAELQNMSNKYQDAETSTIDLTALAKELLFEEGEVYSIRFERDKERKSTGHKSTGESSIFVNDETIGVFGKAFFIVLPLETEVNFNVQTDLEYLEENFNPKKFGLIIDTDPVFQGVNSDKISMAVNTKDITEPSLENIYMAEEFSITPATEYILTLVKKDATTNDAIEIIVPLTKNVKYNLGAQVQTKDEYKKALAEMVLERENIEIDNEEVIDISILSKALEIKPEEEVALYLMPAKHPKQAPAEETFSSVMLDNTELSLSSTEKYTIIVPFDAGTGVNIQTDLGYLEENFAPESYLMNIDTIEFFSEIIVDTTGYGDRVLDANMLSMNVNAESASDVDIKNQLTAREVSIIPGKMYILTVSKKDGNTGEETEIIVPLTKKVKYDFTTSSSSEEEYKVTLDEFLDKNKEVETIDGEVIDISLLSKELQIMPGDEVSFSLLPAKTFGKTKATDANGISSLHLDSKVVEFTQLQQYTIKVPLSEANQMNIQTDLQHIEEKFAPGSYFVDIDTLSFFAEITVDTTGYGSRVIQEEEEITDPVYDVVTVNFGLNQHALQAEAQQIVVDQVINVLSTDRRLYVTIKGYTDALGNADYNMSLSKKRAQSVKNFLRENGIGQSRIRTFSFGASKSLETGVNWEDLSEEELKKHRKVEIVIYLPE